MKMIWIVCWRGLEEEYSSPQEAMDRWDELEARGIEAHLLAANAARESRT